MKPTWSELIDILKRDRLYASESDVTDTDITNAFADAQYELAEELYMADRDYLGYYTDYDETSSITVPPNVRRIQYVEYKENDRPWIPVVQRSLKDRHGLSDTHNVPSGSGTFRVNYTRKPVPPLYGTLSAGTSTTVTFPASPTYGAVDVLDDYYNGCTIRIVSGTGSGQTAVITDYAGSTRVATVSFTTAPSTDSVFNIECDIPEQYIRRGLINGALSILTRDESATSLYEYTKNRIRSTAERAGQSYTSIDAYDFFPDSGYEWYLRGDTIYFYAV